jgi:hypothetical protein
VGADHQDPPVVPQHAQLAVESYDPAGAGRLQLGRHGTGQERQQRENEDDEADACEAQ